MDDPLVQTPRGPKRMSLILEALDLLDQRKTRDLLVRAAESLQSHANERSGECPLADEILEHLALTQED